MPSFKIVDLTKSIVRRLVFKTEEKSSSEHSLIVAFLCFFCETLLALLRRPSDVDLSLPSKVRIKIYFELCEEEAESFL